LRQIAAKGRANQGSQTRVLQKQAEDISEYTKNAKSGNWEHPTNKKWFNWPDNTKGYDAVPGSSRMVTIGQDSVLSRYIRKDDIKNIYGGKYNPKKDKGTYTAPVKVPFTDRSLPGKVDDYIEARYKVMEDFPSIKSKASPYFDQKGNATQFDHDKIQDLLESKEIKYLGEY